MTDYLEATDPTSNPPRCVVSYANFLKDWYRKEFRFIQADEWPPTTCHDEKLQFCNLALVKENRYLSEDEKESMANHYAHGRIDNIANLRKSIELEEMFYPIIDPETSSSRLTILLDGAPGVGKTTIARKLCIDWANGDLLQQYQLVVFVPLREVTVSGYNLATLLQHPIREAEQVAHYLEETTVCGKNTLFILDGYDELSSKCRSKDSFFYKIIAGKIAHNCSVLITSRSYAITDLKLIPQINRCIKVLGFKSWQICNFIERNLSKPAEANKLIQALKERLDIALLCHIPLNCRIVVYVYKLQDFKLPETLTELYEIFLLHTIKRAMTKTNMDNELIQQAHTIEALPPTIKDKLFSLCEVAFGCLKENKLLIASGDITSECYALGLLRSLQSIDSRSISKFYQFLHLTIQEFLAAVYIVSCTNEFKVEFLKNHLNSNRFRMTLLFLAGLTKLEFFAQEKHLLQIDNPSINRTYYISRFSVLDDFIMHDFVEPYEVENLEQKEDFLLIAQLFFESQKTSYKGLVKFRYKTFDLSGLYLSQFDFYIIAHFLSHTPKTHAWDLIDLTNCGLSPDSVVYQRVHCTNSGLIAAGLTRCLRLDYIDTSLLAAILTGNTYLNKVDISNFDHLDHDEVSILCKAIASSQNLKCLLLYATIISKKEIRIRMSSELCPTALTYLLSYVNTKTLEILDISYNPKLFRNCSCGTSATHAVESLCVTLSQCERLQALHLDNCGLTDMIVDKISNALSDKQHLSSLNFNRNKLQSIASVINFEVDSTLSVEVCEMTILLQKTKIDIEGVHVFFSDELIGLLFKNLKIPENFSYLTCRVARFDEDLTTAIIINNQHLEHVAVGSLSSYDSFDEPSCESTLKLVKAIINHKSLQSFTGFGLKISPIYLGLANDAVCTYCMYLLLDHQRETETKAISLVYCPFAFQNCCECIVSEDITEKRLCALISNSSVLKTLDISGLCCRENYIPTIISAIEGCASTELESIEIDKTIGQHNHYMTRLLHFLSGHNKVSVIFDDSFLKIKNNKLHM